MERENTTADAAGTSDIGRQPGGNIAGAADARTYDQLTDASEPILKYFKWDHLPQKLQPISRNFADLAHNLVMTLPRTPERTVALRKLLEGKDAAVRAAL